MNKTIYIIVRLAKGYRLVEMPDEYFFTLNRGKVILKNVDSLMKAVDKVKELKGVLYVNTVSDCKKEPIEREIAVGIVREQIESRVTLLNETKMKQIRSIQETNYACILEDVGV